MRILHERGLLNVRGGNASALVRLPDGSGFVYVTPSGAAKPRLREEDIAVMSPGGHVYWGRPTSEYRLHLRVYERLEGVRAVVHAHNPAAVLAAERGVVLDTGLAGVESRYYIGDCDAVPVAPFKPPGSVELAEAAAEALARCPVAVLEKHGAVAVGFSGDPVAAVYEAVDRLEVLEDLARAALAAGRNQENSPTSI
jgi:L-fuculose-phosphate aldolase